MVHDREGDVVETNVHVKKNGMIFLALPHDEVIRIIEERFDTVATLETMPADLWGPDGTPVYYLSPREAQMRAAARQVRDAQ